MAVDGLKTKEKTSPDPDLYLSNADPQDRLFQGSSPSREHDTSRESMPPPLLPPQVITNLNPNRILFIIHFNYFFFKECSFTLNFVLYSLTFSHA